MFDLGIQCTQAGLILFLVSEFVPILASKFSFHVWHHGCFYAKPLTNLYKGIEMLMKTIGALFVCLWFADFLTGFFHWMEDTYCLEHYPLIGSFICEPNIEHHVDPQLMVRTGTFISRNILQWALCGGLFGLLFLVGLGNVFTFTTLLLTSFGNEIHRWNHMHKTSKFVTFMKDFGIIQAHKQHSMHHKPPHDGYYCVMTSQVNAVLERINFWRRLEVVVKWTTGIAPKREDRRDSRPVKKAKAA